MRIAPARRLRGDDPTPDWVEASLALAPWVVVRRALDEPPWIAVGVRGAARHLRWAAWVAKDDVIERVTPETLTGRLLAIATIRGVEAPGLAAAAAVEAAFRSGAKPLVWGPTGSVGFELASGRPTATAQSDLDALIRCPVSIPRGQALTWAEDFAKAAAPFGVRCDVLLETPQGAVALIEFANGPGPVLLRTAAGPKLVDDPWAEGVPSP